MTPADATFAVPPRGGTAFPPSHATFAAASPTPPAPERSLR